MNSRRTIRKPRAADKTRIPELILQRGEAHGQRCPLKRGKRYRHAPTGRPCTYLAPYMPRDGGNFRGKVVVIFPGEHRRKTVAASTLDTFSKQGGERAA